MRYLGNKDTLLDDIKELLIKNDLYHKNLTFFDAFSGTGSVANNFKDIYKIILNDNLYSSFAYSMGRINAYNCTFEKLGFNPFDYFNSNENTIDGFISKSYAPKLSGRSYFSDFNAGRIDFIRQTIEQWYDDEQINNNEYFYLISSLLESVSKVANVAGVYGACLKTWDPRAVKKIIFLPPNEDEKKTLCDARGFNEDIRNIVSDIDCDILYLDPPYTSNKYPVQYHLLETIALYDSPELKGVTGARANWKVSTAWSTKNRVEIEFDYLLANTKAKYIVLSYSSDGLMSKSFITASLKRYGDESTFQFKEIPYKKYRNTKTKSEGTHYEYLFFIKKKDPSLVRYTCPLNYMGGKTMIVDEILPFTKGKKQFVDLMAGGFNVGINVNCELIVYNDINYIVTNLIKMFRDVDTYTILQFIDKTINKYELAKRNKESFVNYRNEWNKNLSKTKDKYLYLFVLILFGFQQQLRFNTALEFNNTIGESSYNEQNKEKIVSFSRRIKSMNVIFKSLDFEKMEEYINHEDSIVYIDPPYLITLGSYNDGKRGFNGWSPKEEQRLYDFLDKLLTNGVKIVLSNVIFHKNKTNTILISWIKKRGLTIKNINTRGREEVIVTNV